MTDSALLGEAGVSFVALLALEMGLICRPQKELDFGIDAHFETRVGQKASGRLIAAQIKTGKSYLTEETATGFWHRISPDHHEQWINHSLPVIIVLCDLDARVCYWEVVDRSTCVPAGSGWKILVPKAKKLGASGVQELEELAAPICASSDYYIAGTNDDSHAGARRISLDVVAHPAKGATKAALKLVVRSALRDGQETDYVRDAHSAAAHQGRSADVVSGFVYLREVDRSSANWVCRFQWISPQLDERFRPSPISGEEMEEGLIVDWRLDLRLQKFLDNRRVSKLTYLKAVDTIAACLPSIITALDLANETAQERHVSAFIEAAEQFAALWDGQMVPPHECERLAQAVAETRASVGNGSLVWENWLSGTRNLRQTVGLTRRYSLDLVRLVGELDFLRRDVR